MKKMYPCPCCGNLTFENVGNTFAICPVCYWEDDGAQLNNPDYDGGANRVSLNQAKKNYIDFGACEADMISSVRKPRRKEIPTNK